MKRLGERIRKRREILNMHLNELAQLVNITPSALSQIENAKTYPSIVTLKAIAEQLKTTVGELIGENEFFDKHPIVKKNERKLIDVSIKNVEFCQLSLPHPSKYMEAFLIKVPAGVSMSYEHIVFFSNKTNPQIFCYINKGSFLFVLNEIQYRVEFGDSIYFTQRIFKEFLNKSKQMGEMIWILSPSNF